jgi:hypothetical protein
MLDCQTLVCLGTQLPNIGMDDLFVVGYLTVGLAIVIYLVVDTLKEK